MSYDVVVVVGFFAAMVLALVAFAAFALGLIFLVGKKVTHHGGIRGALLESTVVHTHGQVPAAGHRFSSVTVKVSRVQHQTGPAVGLEIQATGMGLALQAVRIDGEQSLYLADALERASLQ